MSYCSTAVEVLVYKGLRLVEVGGHMLQVPTQTVPRLRWYAMKHWIGGIVGYLRSKPRSWRQAVSEAEQSLRRSLCNSTLRGGGKLARLVKVVQDARGAFAADTRRVSMGCEEDKLSKRSIEYRRGAVPHIVEVDGSNFGDVVKCALASGKWQNAASTTYWLSCGAPMNTKLAGWREHVWIGFGWKQCEDGWACVSNLTTLVGSGMGCLAGGLGQHAWHHHGDVVWVESKLCGGTWRSCWRNCMKEGLLTVPAAQFWFNPKEFEELVAAMEDVG
ncbi:hypothetical protein Tco_0026908 [Tanacetum coccineum]